MIYDKMQYDDTLRAENERLLRQLAEREAQVERLRCVLRNILDGADVDWAKGEHRGCVAGEYSCGDVVDASNIVAESPSTALAELLKPIVDQLEKVEAPDDPVLKALALLKQIQATCREDFRETAPQKPLIIP